MKLITIIEPRERRQTFEELIIEFWKKRGVDHDNVEFFDAIKISLVGEHALSAERLERSLGVLQGRTFITLEKSFETSGNLFDVFCKFLEGECDQDVSGTINYSRGFDLNLNRTLAEKIGKAGGMQFLELFPKFYCHRSVTEPETWTFSVGAGGNTLKCWQSMEALEDFGRILESKVLPSEHWKGATLKMREIEGGIAPIVSMRVNAHYGCQAIQDICDEIKQNVFHDCNLYAELLTFFGCDDMKYLVKRAELINRLYRASALPADKISFGLAGSSIHELREVKDEVIGTVFEMLEFPLISSASKGVRFSAKRVFEGDRFLIRMKFAGKEGPCRALLKEMEEELGVEIKIESCK